MEWVPYVIIAVVAVAIITVTAALTVMAVRRQTRRLVAGLAGRRQAVGIALGTTEGVITRLASGSVDDLLVFARSDSEDRVALAEVANKMRIEEHELRTIALPGELVPLAEELAGAAAALASAAGSIGDAGDDGVLEALSALDLVAIRRALEKADERIALAVSEHHVTEDETTAFAGGMYV